MTAETATLLASFTDIQPKMSGEFIIRLYITRRLSLSRHMTYQRLAPTVSIQLFVTRLVAMPTSRDAGRRCFWCLLLVCAHRQRTRTYTHVCAHTHTRLSALQSNKATWRYFSVAGVLHYVICIVWPLRNINRTQARTHAHVHAGTRAGSHAHSRARTFALGQD